MELADVITVCYDPACMEITFEGCVVPQPRQTGTSRYRTDSKGKIVREYLEKQAMLRDLLALRLKQMGIPIPVFAKGVLLLFASSYWSPRASRADLSNFEKSAEDLCNRVVYADDRQIVARGGGAKHITTYERMEITVWPVGGPLL